MRALRSRVRLVSLLSLVAVLASVAWVAYRHWRDRPPFSVSAVHATATVRFTEWSRFEQDARAIGAEDLGARPAGRPDDRLFVGRLEHRTPTGAGDQDVFHVLVVDKRNERFAGVGNLTQGPPSYLAGLSQRYPWLPAPRGAEDGQAWSVAVPANRPGPISFAGGLPASQGLTEADLMVVLVLVGQDGTAYWAARVSG
ncbi:hypothetical protein AB0J80_07250 [Actinoplanes sp. NPDC049548]|uniref:hypothetical protein n=1 Tax=Actinoplanes sp. NPDC049548 TaxID=3155152 RepID=UPI003426F696